MTRSRSFRTANSLDYSHAARWKHKDLFKAGFVQVPIDFLTLYSKLNPPLTNGEALFVIQVMSFKWTATDPFPGYKRIASRMGVTDKAVRRHASRLEAKNYLTRIQRLGTTNKFDFSKLFDALLEAKKKLEEEGGPNHTVGERS